MSDITAIILTYNEEKNLKDCLESIKDLVSDTLIVDSFSSDKTLEIAKSYGCSIIQHEFKYHSDQYNYAIQNYDFKSKWILWIDADERLTKESSQEIARLIKEHDEDDINGIFLRFKLFFLGKYLKHGGNYPFLKLSVYKIDKTYCENKKMDEHIILKEGKTIEVKYDSLHRPNVSLFEWINKHNRYSELERDDFFNRSNIVENYSGINKKKSKLKKIYYKLPSGFRAKIYYFYRFIIKGGFLDGKPGKYYCFLQAYWYRYLIDIKIYERKIDK